MTRVYHFTRAPSTTETASGKREHQSGTHGSPGSKPMQRASTISTMDVWESLAQSVALVQPHSEALGTAIFRWAHSVNLAQFIACVAI